MLQLLLTQANITLYNINTSFKTNRFPTFLPLPNGNGVFGVQPDGEQQFASGTETN